MIEPLYTAEVTSTGGRADGRARSTDGNLDVPVGMPGGGGEGTNPEELFAAGYSACFASAAMLLARQMKLDPTGLEVQAQVTLGRLEDGMYGLAVGLDLNGPALTQEQADQLVAAAHEVCPYSRATRGNVDVTLTASGGAA